MSLKNLQGSDMQRISRKDANTPERVAGTLLRIKCNLAVAVQRLPEMTDDEVIKANANVGGFAWLDDPAEDVYSQA